MGSRRTRGAGLLVCLLAASAGSCNSTPIQHEPQLHPYGTGVKPLQVNCAARAGIIRPLVATNRGPVTWPSDPAGSVYDFAENYRQFGIDTIRSHDFYGPTDWWTIFPDFSAAASAPASYDFASSDARIAAIRDAGFQCLYQLGTSWRGDNPLPINDPPGTIRGPNGQIVHEADRDDFRKWAQVCANIVRHYNHGWADGHQYGIGYWETWNEPDLAEQFWSGTAMQYFMLYEETAKALKKLRSPSGPIKVGGPALSGAFTDAYLDDFLAYCQQTNTPLDFYSWHCYGGRDQYNPHCYYEYGRRIRDALDEHGYGQADSFITEWNAGIGDNAFSDTPAGVAYYASALMNMLDGGVIRAFQYVGDNHPMLGLHDHETAMPVRAAQSLVAWKRMQATPLRVAAVGSDENGYNIVAGVDELGRCVQILISDFQSEYTGYALRVTGLPWTDQTPFQATRWVLDPSRTQLEAVETVRRTGRTLLLKRSMGRRTITLIEIRRGWPTPQPNALPAKPLLEPVRLRPAVRLPRPRPSDRAAGQRPPRESHQRPPGGRE